MICTDSGDISFGIGTVVVVPGVLVHRVEGHAAGLHGSRPGGGGAHDVPWDIKSVWRHFSCRGLSSARFGWMPSNPAIQGVHRRLPVQ